MCCNNDNCWTGFMNNVRYETDTDTPSVNAEKYSRTSHDRSAKQSSPRKSKEVE